MKKLLLIPLMLALSTTALANDYWIKQTAKYAAEETARAVKEAELQQLVCDFRENYMRNLIEVRRANISEEIMKYELYSLFAKDEIDVNTLKEANDVIKETYALPQYVIDSPNLSETLLEEMYLSCFK